MSSFSDVGKSVLKPALQTVFDFCIRPGLSVVRGVSLGFSETNTEHAGDEPAMSFSVALEDDFPPPSAPGAGAARHCDRF